MARSITDCTGKTITLGDKVQTESGEVIEVCGALISEHKLHNAETCTLVPPETPLTSATIQPVPADAPAPTALEVFDCVVWGA